MSKPKIAFQGEPGAYSEAAAYEYFRSEIKTIPCNSFEQVFIAVSEEACSFGLVPIENSLAGSIHRNYDLLLRYDLLITAEYYLRVSHCLLALPEVRLNDIKQVYSHPQALAQCESSLSALGIERVAKNDTAGSARLIRDQKIKFAAALASRHAATVYDLQILRDNMEDNPENFTRFLALARSALQNDLRQGDDFKTSIVFSLINKPGVLFKALSIFASREIDLTKIESRPLVGKPWEYLFYIDFSGHVTSKSCAAALDHLAEITPFLRVLGSYPRHNCLLNTSQNPAKDL